MISAFIRIGAGTQHGWRSASRLDWTPRRHRALGPGVRSDRTVQCWSGPHRQCVWNVALKYTVGCTVDEEVTAYPNDVLPSAAARPPSAWGNKWLAPMRWVWVDRSGFDANPEWVKMDSLPDAQRRFRSTHRQSIAAFLDSVKSRKPTIAPVGTPFHNSGAPWRDLHACRPGSCTGM